MTTLITGGTGTLGLALARRFLAEHETVRLYSRDEAKHAHAREELDNHPSLRTLVGDVRDRHRLTRAMMGCDTVIHAAAMKRVEACESDPDEAIATNVLGTQNVVAAALVATPRRVIFISSDKACDPINTYGSTKLAGERLIQNASSYAGGFTPRFVGVRYGNVVGSRGSVTTIWRKQMALKGELTITDPEATRFWITLDQAVELVIHAGAFALPGDIIIPELGASTLAELAGALWPNRAAGTWAEMFAAGIGLGPGEKKHETLLSPHEVKRARWQSDHLRHDELPWRLLALRPIREHTTPTEDVRTAVRGSYRLSSDLSARRLTRDVLQRMVR